MDKKNQDVVSRYLHSLLEKYMMHSEFAAGYAEQQAIDREAGAVVLACHAQERAAFHAAEARAYRAMFTDYVRPLP